MENNINWISSSALTPASAGWVELYFQFPWPTHPTNGKWKMTPFVKLNGKQPQFNGRWSWLTNLTWPELGTAQPQLVLFYCYPTKNAKMTWPQCTEVRLSSLIGWKLKLLNHRVYCMQIDRLGHTVSMQKTIIQTNHPSPRYEQKRDGLVCAKPNHHVYANISSYKAPFELSFFALKSCVLSSCLQ